LGDAHFYALLASLKQPIRILKGTSPVKDFGIEDGSFLSELTGYKYSENFCD
jgi:hypothetical protein